jgi:DNA-directed RNA polymerase specialized sigma24 family protein
MEYTNSQIREIIEEHIHKKRDREVLLRFYADKITQEKIAEEFEMSVRGIQYIIARTRETIADNL